MLGVSPESVAMLLRQAKRRARLKKKLANQERRQDKPVGGYNHVQWDGHIGGWGYRK